MVKRVEVSDPTGEIGQSSDNCRPFVATSAENPEPGNGWKAEEKRENGRPWDVRKINRAGLAVHVLRIRMRNICLFLHGHNRNKNHSDETTTATDDDDRERDGYIRRVCGVQMNSPSKCGSCSLTYTFCAAKRTACIRAFRIYFCSFNVCTSNSPLFDPSE
uniref:HDC16210 n=1 Tax=Drosophila melanogaster TaxID=7227 RepID=Q6IJ09_DROME|nr:TPA_inf: HDC16210 [Drosophila melanogaster]